MSWRVHSSSPRHLCVSVSLCLPTASLTGECFGIREASSTGICTCGRMCFTRYSYILWSFSFCCSIRPFVESPEVDTSPAIGLEASRLGLDYPAHSLMHTEPCATYILLLQFFETVPCHSDSCHSLQFKASFYTIILSRFLFFVLFLFVLTVLFIYISEVVPPSQSSLPSSFLT